MSVQWFTSSRSGATREGEGCGCSLLATSAASCRILAGVSRSESPLENERGERLCILDPPSKEGGDPVGIGSGPAPCAVRNRAHRGERA